MKLARPTNISRIDAELQQIINEIAERNGINKLDASRILARSIYASKNKMRINIV